MARGILNRGTKQPRRKEPEGLRKSRRRFCQALALGAGGLPFVLWLPPHLCVTSTDSLHSRVGLGLDIAQPEHHPIRSIPAVHVPPRKNI
jgi:hypothetical protein